METRRQRVDLNYLKAYYIHDNLRILISNRLLKQVTGNRNIFFFYGVMIFIHCNKTRIKTSDQFEHVKTIGKLVSLTISNIKRTKIEEYCWICYSNINNRLIYKARIFRHGLLFRIVGIVFEFE